MNELYFVGMDIVEETKNLMKLSEEICTDGMTESELKAYEMGVKNTLSALRATMDNEDDMMVVNIDGFEVPTELSIDDLEGYYSSL